MQPGDVKATYADTARLTEWTKFSPGTPVRVGVKRFAEWYQRITSRTLINERALRSASTKTYETCAGR